MSEFIERLFFLTKNAFGIDFGAQEVPKLINMHFHFYAFSGWGTS